MPAEQPKRAKIEFCDFSAVEFSEFVDNPVFTVPPLAPPPTPDGLRHFVRTYGEAGTFADDPDWRPNCTVETDASGKPIPNGAIVLEVGGYLSKGCQPPPSRRF